MVASLLTSSEIDPNFPDKWENTPLIKAFLLQQSDIADLIMNDPRVNYLAKNSEGRSVNEFKEQIPHMKKIIFNNVYRQTAIDDTIISQTFLEQTSKVVKKTDMELAQEIANRLK